MQSSLWYSSNRGADRTRSTGEYARRYRLRRFPKDHEEVSKGLLTNRELEQRIGSVYEHARLATLNSGAAKPPDDFGPSAEEMLRSIIENNHKSLLSAADRFSKACKSQSF